MTVKLDLLYREFLRLGFIVLREASEAGDLEWVKSEIELLHNVPSLIAEPKVGRHEYFWLQERTRYVEWAAGPGREKARTFMVAYYEPLWGEMEPLIPITMP